MARSTDEWIGKTDDSAPTQSCLIRIFTKAGGRCQDCGRKLVPGKWDADHIVRLKDGGANREANLQALCRVPCHQNKTGEENSQGAKSARVYARQIGAKKPSRNPVPGSRNTRFKKKVNGDVVNRRTGEVIRRGRA